ncbi:ubiquinol-cytochrome C chaperone family protein [Hyphobacterium marinum]|uniref:Ubiquinol-cytochrome C chaperone family protein n=1 Tax=Hyphobacterium marinum TaxID=3116574 RepID=A0ABU7LYN0_9PROT|nr:ubiquinol-cytochrome C chaperone family protein [Hyphobacterium sp. Y6023]MEE2566666.1 ubiquinol-cytochrome C chaperone family protein [Hyphobacterium sp. Y6023]
MGDSLYQAAVGRARQPVIYREQGVPDTPEGRFEMICLYMSVLIERLNREGETGRAVAQETFDAMFRDLDGALREMAVGDLSVSKKIKALASHFYTALEAYTPAIKEGDAVALSSALAETPDLDARPNIEALASGALTWRGGLAECPGEALLRGETCVSSPEMSASA